MNYINYNSSLELVIDDDLYQVISKLGIGHYPKEFGGFLLGHYSENRKTLFIDFIVNPSKYFSNDSSFQRSIDGIENTFNQIFIEKNIYYVGEWHTHPNGSSMFSKTDLKAMISIAESETVRINNPILLIFGINFKREVSSTFYLYNNRELKCYEQNKHP